MAWGGKTLHEWAVTITHEYWRALVNAKAGRAKLKALQKKLCLIRAPNVPPPEDEVASLMWENAMLAAIISKRRANEKYGTGSEHPDFDFLLADDEEICSLCGRIKVKEEECPNKASVLHSYEEYL